MAADEPVDERANRTISTTRDDVPGLDPSSPQRIRAAPSPAPKLVSRWESGRELPAIVWRFDQPLRAIASGSLGGGIGVRRWVVNATVPMSYARLDPDRHIAELAHAFELDGAGVGMLTGLDVREVVAATDEGVDVAATVGLGEPGWAAHPTSTHSDLAVDTATHPDTAPIQRGHPQGQDAPVGTVNIVAFVPAPLADAALVNAVVTVTEAKAQALRDLGYPATGTATDAVCITCTQGSEPDPHCGPRSDWGARLARAVHAAVIDGGERWVER